VLLIALSALLITGFLAASTKEAWCLPPPQSFPGSLIGRAFRAGGLEVPRTCVSVHSIQMQNALLATGRFITILPETMMRFSAQRLGLKALSVHLPIEPTPVAIVTLKNRELSPVGKLFIERARTVAASLATNGVADARVATLQRWVSLLSPIIVRREFGAKAFGLVFGVASCGIQLATALGPILYSLLHDAFGSYNPALIGAAGLDVAAAVVAIAGRGKPTAR
jgi:LysR substrate binding domain